MEALIMRTPSKVTRAGAVKGLTAALRRERRKMERNLRGIRRMNKLPSCLVVIDPRREHLAVSEARKLGIPTVGLIDTDGDPELVDIPIPGNDDAMKSIDLVVKKIAEAIAAGKAKQAHVRLASRDSSEVAAKAETDRTAVAQVAAPEKTGEGQRGETDPAPQGPVAAQ